MFPQETGLTDKFYKEEITMYGIDISRWQKGIDLSKDNTEFVIMKATEGVGYTDPCFKSHLEQSTKLNKLIGCYHFARPDLNGTTERMKQEAKYFCKVMEENGLIGKAIFVLDWETKPVNDESLAFEWLRTVEDITGTTPLIYCSQNTTQYLHDTLLQYPLWIARWPFTYNINFDESDTILKNNKNQFPNRPFHIWQFSSRGTLNGFSGNVDLDYTDLTVSQWKDFANYPIESKVEFDEEIFNESVYALNEGFFVKLSDDYADKLRTIPAEKLKIFLECFKHIFDA